MTTTVFLVRHAPHPLQDSVLAGRMPNLHLNDSGRIHAMALAERLAERRLTALFTSPQPRAIETGEAIAMRTGLMAKILDAADEVDIGDWTGRTFEQMNEEPLWREWNADRGVRIPGGETMQEVQDRIIAGITELRDSNPAGRVAIVSHGDVIRAALLYYLGLSLDDYERIEVSPASISVVQVGDWGARLECVNERVAP